MEMARSNQLSFSTTWKSIGVVVAVVVSLPLSQLTALPLLISYQIKLQHSCYLASFLTELQIKLSVVHNTFSFFITVAHPRCAQFLYEFVASFKCLWRLCDGFIASEKNNAVCVSPAESFLIRLLGGAKVRHFTHCGTIHQKLDVL